MTYYGKPLIELVSLTDPEKRSRSELRRLAKQGGITFYMVNPDGSECRYVEEEDKVVIKDLSQPLTEYPVLIRIGKRRVIKVVLPFEVKKVDINSLSLAEKEKYGIL